VHGAARTFDEVIMPALSLAEIDRRKGALEPARERFVFDQIRRMVEKLPLPASATPIAPSSICIVAAHDEADRIAALMAARVLAPAQACVIGAPALAAEIAHTAAERQCTAVLISAVPPKAAHYAGYLARRLRRELPKVKIVVGLWAGDSEVGVARERLLKLGVDQVLSRVGETPSVLRQLQKHKPAANEPTAKHSARR
jgi:hypothetical protein